MEAREQFRLLYTFLGGYLHEDWMYEFPDPDVAYRAFLDVVSAEELPRLIAEIDEVLRLDEARFAATFRRLSRNFTPSTDDGRDEREWLQSLRDRAAAELASKSGAG